MNIKPNTTCRAGLATARDTRQPDPRKSDGSAIRTAFIVSACLFTLAVAPVSGTIISVPDDYPSIQEAVNAAVPGDVVQVKAIAGPYIENVVITTSDITLKGIGQAEIQAASPANPALQVLGSGVRVERFDCTGVSSGTSVIVGGFNSELVKVRSFGGTSASFDLSGTGSWINKCTASESLSGFRSNGGVEVYKSTAESCINDGFALTGEFGQGSLVEKCRSYGNGFGYTVLSDNNQVNKCKAEANIYDGYQVWFGTGSVLSRNKATGNTSGFFLNSGGNVVLWNNASENTSVGYWSSVEVTLVYEKNVAKENGFDGFTIGGDGTNVIDCVATMNSNDGFDLAGSYMIVSGCKAVKNTGDGFVIQLYSNILSGCKADRNSLSGFFFGTSSEQNLIYGSKATANTGYGIVDNSGATPETVNNYYGSNKCANNGAGASLPAGLCD